MLGGQQTEGDRWDVCEGDYWDDFSEEGGCTRPDPGEEVKGSVRWKSQGGGGTWGDRCERDRSGSVGGGFGEQCLKCRLRKGYTYCPCEIQGVTAGQVEEVGTWQLLRSQKEDFERRVRWKPGL